MAPGRTGRMILMIRAGVCVSPPGVLHLVAANPTLRKGRGQPGLVGRTQPLLPEEGWPSRMADQRLQANSGTPTSIQAAEEGVPMGPGEAVLLGTGQSQRRGAGPRAPPSVVTVPGLFPFVIATTLLKKCPTLC